MEKKANYQDPEAEGVSLEKLQTSVWLIEKKRYFYYAINTILALIGFLTLPRFIYTFGEYIFVGMASDSAQIREMVAYGTVSHDQILARAALPITAKPVDIITNADNRYDLAAEIANPNMNHWAEFKYSFLSGGNAVITADGYIMPGESKFILALGKDLSAGRNAVFTFNNIAWHRIDKHQYPDYPKFRDEHFNIIIDNKKFIPAQSSFLSEKLNLNELDFTAQNNTAYSYQAVNLQIILLNGASIAGVNRYTLERFESGGKKDIKMTWLGRLGNISEIRIVPEMNIFSPDIYFTTAGKVEGSQF